MTKGRIKGKIKKKVENSEEKENLAMCGQDV